LRAVGSLAALNFDELADECPVSTIQEVENGRLLSIEPKTAAALLGSADAIIGNESAIQKAIRPYSDCKRNLV
jgi:hypothetical protein